jgi:hypothetical protein
MALALPVFSRTETSKMKLNIIWVSLTLAMRRWLYFSVLYFETPFYWSSLLILINWYEFLSLAPIFKIAVPFAVTFMFPGTAENSIGLYCCAAPYFPLSSTPELLLDIGPLITAAVFTKVKSMSKS